MRSAGYSVAPAMLALFIILLAFGLVPCLIGGIFLAVYVRNRQRVSLMQRTPTSPAASVAGLRAGDVVEVKGMLRCPKPLMSDLTRIPCVAYAAWVERVYHEDEQSSDGAWEMKERSETLARSARRVPFFVEDDSGRVRVQPEGANLEAQLVSDRFEERPVRGKIRFGGRAVDANHGGRTLGYRVREEVLPVDAPVYVLGVVTPDGEIGRAREGATAVGDAAFVISYRSEEAMSRSHDAERWILWAGAGALAGGLVILAIALVVFVLFL